MRVGGRKQVRRKKRWRFCRSQTDARAESNNNKHSVHLRWLDHSLHWITKHSFSFSQLLFCFFFHQRWGNKRSLQCFTAPSQGYLGKCHSVGSKAHLPTLFSHFNLEECWAQAAHQQQTQGQEINLFFYVHWLRLFIYSKAYLPFQRFTALIDFSK